MKAIELKGKVDEKGILRLDMPLKLTNTQVKVIVLVPEVEDDMEDMFWLQGISVNNAFDFLSDEAENIYSLTDGVAANYEA